MNYKDKLKKGLIEMLLLKILSEEDCYGYQITQIMKEVSYGTIIVREASMYPILYRLQERDLISSYRQKGNGRMERVYYHLKNSGKEELLRLVAAYKEIETGVNAILNFQYMKDLEKYK